MVYGYAMTISGGRKWETVVLKSGEMCVEGLSPIQRSPDFLSDSKKVIPKPYVENFIYPHRHIVRWKSIFPHPLFLYVP